MNAIGRRGGESRSRSISKTGFDLPLARAAIAEPKNRCVVQAAFRPRGTPRNLSASIPSARSADVISTPPTSWLWRCEGRAAVVEPKNRCVVREALHPRGAPWNLTAALPPASSAEFIPTPPISWPWRCEGRPPIPGYPCHRRVRRCRGAIKGRGADVTIGASDGGGTVSDRGVSED